MKTIKVLARTNCGGASRTVSAKRNENRVAAVALCTPGASVARTLRVAAIVCPASGQQLASVVFGVPVSAFDATSFRCRWQQACGAAANDMFAEAVAGSRLTSADMFDMPAQPARQPMPPSHSTSDHAIRRRNRVAVCCRRVFTVDDLNECCGCRHTRAFRQQLRRID